MKQVHKFTQSIPFTHGEPVDKGANVIKIRASSREKAEKMLLKKHGKYPSVGSDWIYLGAN